MEVAFHYVLILEWLDTGDRRTGAELHGILTARGVPSRLVVCESWDDIVHALADAAQQLAVRGHPAIHLETHGSDPWDGCEEDIGFGAGGSVIPWSELGRLLSPLNQANDFRLFFVSAACWGSGVMAAMGHGEYPAPFAVAVGFRTRVSDARLLDAMKELYRRAFAGDPLPDCIASARNKLTAGQEMRIEYGAEVAAKIVREVFLHPINPNPRLTRAERLRRVREIWNRWFPVALQERDPSYRFEITSLRP